MPENDNPQQQGDPGQLGDAGKAALVAERKRADDAEKALKDVSARLKQLEDADKSDLDKARAEIESLKAENVRLTAENAEQGLQITRLNVGIDEGLPKNLIARLQGSDEETFKADAASLKELVPSGDPSSPFPAPKADPSQGGKGGQGKQSTGQQFADAVSGLLN